MKKQMTRRYREVYANSPGFSLPELMLVMVFIAIIASISIPTYTEYVRDKYRSEAQAIMLQISVTLDSILNANGRLEAQDGTDYYTLIDDLGYECFPEGDCRYQMALNFPTPDTYTITLTPVGAQREDPCSLNALELNSQNQKFPVEAAGEDCWP